MSLTGVRAHPHACQVQIVHQCISFGFGDRDLEYFGHFGFPMASQLSATILREKYAKHIADELNNSWKHWAFHSISNLTSRQGMQIWIELFACYGSIGAGPNLIASI
jgi:hypothetical protein